MPENRIHSIAMEIAGKTLSIETGRVGRQAGGAVWVRMGDTIVHAAATMSSKPREGIDFFPLVVDYEERKYAVGKIPGGFIKRGGRPSDKAVLTSRLIDRPMRPLFPAGMRHEVQIVALPLSVEQACPPDVLALTAASAALTISDIPWNGPVGGVRVSRVNGEFVLFPSVDETLQSDIDLVVAGTSEAIIMVEMGASEVSEEHLFEALDFAFEGIKQIVDLQRRFAEGLNITKTEVPLFAVEDDVYSKVSETSSGEIRAAIQNSDKAAREDALRILKDDIVNQLKPEFDEEKHSQLGEAVDKIIKREIRALILNDQKRPDGRGWKDVREIACDVGLLPRVHGSGLFQRGQTQVLTTLTLGTLDDSQTVDGLEEEGDRHYMHFYNFPPYSVGEVRPMRGPGRREVGHGALAERALRQMMPDHDTFPYAMLLTSEVMESNGSTSMASVCGSTLALMDAGVPIKAPVAGIAMGLVTDGDRYAVLTDIQGMEDATGDMDFKVAGTRKGINALQLDTKISGVASPVLKEAVAQAKDARMFLLDKITERIPEPRAELSPYAPRIFTIEINQEKIGEVIGPGGRVIRKITADTNTKIDIQPDGKVFIAALDQASADAARQIIEGLTREATVGEVFTGKVTRLLQRGAFVEILPGKEGLCPIEELTPRRVRRPEDVVKIGDEVTVRVAEIDHMGRVNLSARGLEQTLESLKLQPGEEPAPERSFGDRGGRGGGFGGRGGDRGGRGGGGYGGPQRGGDRPSGGFGGRERFDDRGGRGAFEPRAESSEKPPERERQHEFSRREEEPDDTPGARFRPKR